MSIRFLELLQRQTAPMKILLANPRGFCAGVNMAIECLDEAIRMFGANIYVYHEIVHNKYVVNRFTNLGVTFVDDIAEVPRDSILLLFGIGSNVLWLGKPLRDDCTQCFTERRLGQTRIHCHLTTIHLACHLYHWKSGG